MCSRTADPNDDSDVDCLEIYRLQVVRECVVEQLILMMQLLNKE